MLFYHYTPLENVESVRSEGLKLSCERASPPSVPTRICLCINENDWASKGICLRVNIPDDKIIYPSYLGKGNFNGSVLEFSEDIPPEWIAE